MKKQKASTLRFQVSRVALFGDSINGRESERGAFTINGEMFMSMEPVSRQHAVEINQEMTALRKQLDESERAKRFMASTIRHGRALSETFRPGKKAAPARSPERSES